MRRVQEGIISTKNGDKTFEEIYGNGMETTADDEVNASRYSQCFESIARGAGAKRLQEAEAKKGSKMYDKGFDYDASSDYIPDFKNAQEKADWTAGVKASKEKKVEKKVEKKDEKKKKVKETKIFGQPLENVEFKDTSSFVRGLISLKNSFYNLVVDENLDVINYLMTSTYPFDKSFDEVSYEVSDWVDNVVEELTSYGNKVSKDEMNLHEAYVRKTQDEWIVEGFYEGRWEELTSEENRLDAIAQRKCYDENERGVSHRVRKIKVKIDESTGILKKMF